MDAIGGAGELAIAAVGAGRDGNGVTSADGLAVANNGVATSGEPRRLRTPATIATAMRMATAVNATGTARR
jgi:hypothetical protein